MAKTLNAVGANIFAGGFTLGVSKHFNILAHLEHDDYGVEVTRANFKHPVFIGTGAWPEKANPAKPIHFLYSNPPCAIWSLAGNRNDRIDWRLDPRLQRIRDIFTLVDRYRPQVWCWESVCQAFEKGRPFVEEIAAEAAKIGYSASYVLIDAMYLRAPMTRKRFFLVLHRVAIDWAKFRPDFDAPPILPRDVLKGVKDDGTSKEFKFSTPIGKQIMSVLKATPPGGRLAHQYEMMVEKGKIKHEISARGTNVGKPSFLAYRINPDKISGVLFCDKTFHATEPRLLSLPELGVLHGFPKEYDWVSNRHRVDIQRGVLPPVGEWLAKAVAASIRANKPVKKPERTLVDFRRPPGSVQDVIALPADVDLNWKAPKPAAAALRPGSRDFAMHVAAETSDRARKRAGANGANATNGASTPTPGARAGKGRTSVSGAPFEGGKPVTKQRVTSTAADGPRKERKNPLENIDLAAYRKTARGVCAAADRGTAPRTSGELLRARILEGKMNDDAMAAEVRKLWPGRTTSRSDVAWNRGWLKKAGLIT